MNNKFPQITKYRPINREKYVGDINNIIMRSSWEVWFARWADSNPNVLKWGSETRSIPYYSQAERKHRNYFVDFFILIKNKNDEIKRFLVEIKPRSQIDKPKKKSNNNKYLKEMIEWQRNQDKWRSAIEFAKKHDANFIVLDEYALGIK